MLKKIFLLFFIAITFWGEAKLPQLSSKDVQIKVNEILKSHIQYKKLTPFLIERIFKNFIDELDPGKVYFIESDIHNWINLSDRALKNSLKNFKQGDFSEFKTIYALKIAAIKRRRKLERETEVGELPQSIDPEEFKQLKWVSSKEELINRLLRIKALQLEAAEKILKETKEQLSELIKKRRQHEETEILKHNEEQHNSLIFTYILKATCNALDSHTTYFTPFEAQQFLIQVQQRLLGIGVQLRDSLSGFTIVRILDGSPASKNKLKVNDRIVAVNNEPIVGMNLDNVVELIRGEKGTSVLLTIVRETKNKTEKLDVNITRGEIILEDTRHATSYEPYGDGIITLLRLYSFYQDAQTSSALDLKKTIEQLKNKHTLKGIILDLRNNSGGPLKEAVAITSLFITKGIVVSVKDSTGHIEHLRNHDEKTIWDGPLIILTNRASASASEIVAQTLQEYGRAIVVGEDKTFGKGTFQIPTFDSKVNPKINPQGEYKVTRGIYYTVSGKSPQLIGVKSDIVVPGILSGFDIGEEFAKYPLQNDEIEPNFDDNLSDIPLLHRKRMSFLYKRNMQKKITTYTQYIDLLRSNSEKRLVANKNYQKFLQKLKNKKFDKASDNCFEQNDFQLTEAYNIAKDLIFCITANNKQFTLY